MKKLLTFLLLISFIKVKTQTNFIAKWYFSAPTTTVSFYAQTSGGPVSYSWLTKPSGKIGTGTLTNTTAGVVTLAGITVISGDTLIVKMDPTNLKRFYNSSSNADAAKLVDVAQWGSVKWTSMEKAFWGCSNLQISATDIPDLSLVTSMKQMFQGCSKLNGPANIASWNTGGITDMSALFSGAAAFNQNINSWNISKVKDMSFTFASAKVFNQPLNKWNTQSVTNMSARFYGAESFNQLIDVWNTQNVTSMSDMFSYAKKFNQPLNSWNISNVKDISFMFLGAFVFNQPLDKWNTHHVTTTECMFKNAISFNQPIGMWDMSNVTIMDYMFDNATAFNQPLNTWLTTNLTSISFMFREAISFNQNINTWNTSKVINMMRLFQNAKAFNQPLNNWNTAKVYSMHSMFYNARSFNQDISDWDVFNVKNMACMFDSAKAFNQNLGKWKFSSYLSNDHMLDSCGMDCSNYSATLIGWDLNNPSSQLMIIGALGLKYGNNAIAARNSLTGSLKKWYFIGDMPSGTDCLTPTVVDNLQTSPDVFIKTYPNPFTNSFDLVSENEQSYIVNLFQIDGRRIKTLELPANGQLHYDTSELAAGVYMLQLNQNNSVKITYKIIKE